MYAETESDRELEIGKKRAKNVQLWCKHFSDIGFICTYDRSVSLEQTRVLVGLVKKWDNIVDEKNNKFQKITV